MYIYIYIYIYMCMRVYVYGFLSQASDVEVRGERKTAGKRKTGCPLG